EEVRHGGTDQAAIGDVEHDVAPGPVTRLGDRVAKADVTVLLAKHVGTDQPAALGDSEHAGVVVEPGVAERRYLTPEPLERTMGSQSATDLGLRHVIGIAGIDPVGRRAPRHEHTPLARREKPFAPTAGRAA